MGQMGGKQNGKSQLYVSCRLKDKFMIIKILSLLNKRTNNKSDGPLLRFSISPHKKSHRPAKTCDFATININQ